MATTDLALGNAPTADLKREKTATAPSCEQRMNNGANWFFWIAALTVVNTVLVMSGAKWQFIIGLGITQLVDYVAQGLGTAGHAAAAVIDLTIAAVIATFGVFARRKHLWAFVVGMICYGLDAGLFLLAGDWLGLGFHAFALFGIYGGVAALRQLRNADAGLAVLTPSPKPIG